MRNLLPVPIVPHKGQSLSLRMPPNQPPLLNRVLFAQDTYVVPKADGRIIVGATVEPGSFDPAVTPAGIMHCIENAVRLMPELANLPMEECWAGMRPTTPDKLPILGKTSWDNLYIAGGYWRNGVLLSPKTGQLMGDLINGCLSPEDEELLELFSWERFVTKEGGTKLAVTSRYAASLYPTQRRAKGFGVSTSVGTELGFYSGAHAATEERKKDRESLFGVSDDALEKAAQMGISDASAFDFRAASISSAASSSAVKEPTAASPQPLDASSYLDSCSNKASSNDGLADAYTVGSSEPMSPSTRSVIVQANAPKAGEPDEKTFDGYVVIQQANSATTREEELERMKAARQSNRSTSSVDVSKIGAASWSDASFSAEKVAEAGNKPPVLLATETKSENPLRLYSEGDMASIYQRISQNKANSMQSGVQMGETLSDGRPDPGFRIYHLNPVTQKTTLIPPYTRPEVFLAEIGAGEDLFHTASSTQPNEPHERTYDGYVAIQEANGAKTREEELEAMKRARQSNRLNASEIDTSKIGVQRMEE